MPLLEMGVNRRPSDRAALRSGLLQYLGTGLGPTHASPFASLQMRCLSTPTLLRALAQAARAGRTKGAFPGALGSPIS